MIGFDEGMMNGCLVGFPYRCRHDTREALPPHETALLANIENEDVALKMKNGTSYKERSIRRNFIMIKKFDKMQKRYCLRLCIVAFFRQKLKNPRNSNSEKKIDQFFYFSFLY